MRRPGCRATVPRGGNSLAREAQIHYRRLLTVILLVGSALLGRWTPGHDANASSSRLQPGSPLNPFPQLPLSFEPNRGQSATGTLFLARTTGYSISLTRNGLEIGRQHPIRIHLAGASTNVRILGSEKLPGSVNYLIGNVPARWHVDIPTYRAVIYRNVYPGIDLSYAGRRGGVEATWLLRPGADAGRIRLAIGGASRLQLDSRGNLTARTSDSHFTMSAPMAYQVIRGLRRSVPVRFRLVGRAGLVLQTGVHDRSRPLVVDPTLSYGTNLGGSNSDFASGIAVDPAGNSYVAGSTASPDFPVVRAVQPREPGTTDQEDAFVAKLNPAGTDLLFSTYLGGNNDEDGAAIALGRNGAVYVAGFTRSSNFPIRHALQQQRGGCNSRNSDGDAFVVKLSARGDTLLYGTCLGGSATDWATGIAVDHAGAAVVSGATASSDFPVVNAYQRHVAGSVDAFVAKLAPTGTRLLYSTYVGGKAADTAAGVAMDPQGNAYVAGTTSSLQFPQRSASVAPRAVDATRAFLVKLDSAGRHLRYVRYLGGSGADVALGVAVDVAGAAYVTGETTSADFPTTHPLQSKFGGGTDAFVLKVAPGGKSIDFSTYLGGTGNDVATAIAVDASGRVHITGSTTSPDFPVQHALQLSYAGGYFYGDAFVAELAPDGQSLLYSTYLGGTGDDVGTSIAVDRQGAAYVTGGTSSADFPVTRELSGGRPSRGNAFVVRVVDNPS